MCETAAREEEARAVASEEAAREEEALAVTAEEVSTFFEFLNFCPNYIMYNFIILLIIISFFMLN